MAGGQAPEVDLRGRRRRLVGGHVDALAQLGDGLDQRKHGAATIRKLITLLRKVPMFIVTASRPSADADGHVHHVAPRREFLELVEDVQHRSVSSRRSPLPGRISAVAGATGVGNHAR
jgi:hypothetical protein